MSELIDNRAQHRRQLKEIIKRLHAGEPEEAIRPLLRTLVGETTSAEIGAMEQELIAEGMAVEEIMGMCDLHRQVLSDLIAEPASTDVPPGHPVDTFRHENAALTAEIAAARGSLAALAALTNDGDPTAAVADLRAHVARLMEVERHYERKEQLLFSLLERHDVSGPSKVMWGKDDEARGLLKAARDALQAGEATAAEWQLVGREVIAPALAALEEMIAKEEKILLPMSLDLLTEQEWAEIWRQSPDIGWCLVEPATEYRPPDPVRPEQPIAVPAEGEIVFASGALSVAQLEALFRYLPVDLTFVDAEDRVRFFSEGPRRIFQRSPAIIGRDVQHCHPPKSVHVVEKILADFKAGRQDGAEFWIQMAERFVYIRYFAVRDAERRYLGTLEVTQDVTGIRQLEGERRLLQYEAPAAL